MPHTRARGWRVVCDRIQLRAHAREYDWLHMQLADAFDYSFITNRNELALEIEDASGVRALSFGELDDRSNRLARHLRARGVTRGDRIGVYLSNRLEFIDLFIACIRLGAILVPINVLYRDREIAHIVGDAEPLAVVTTREAFVHFRDGVTLWDVDELSARAAEESPERVRVALHVETPAALVYTSGTTGRSKGAILTHMNFVVNAANLIACWRIDAADRYLAVLPLFHVHGLGNGVVSWLMSSCRMRLVERFEAQRAAELFTTFGPTLFFGVPTMYVRLLELPADVARTIGQRMRLFVCGSAPLPAQVLEAFRERFGHTILERYGMSETLMNLSNPYEGERRPGSVGHPLPGISVRIAGPDGTEAGTDVVGELLVRGPNVCAGYWRRPDADAAAFVDGWFRTGDLAERSADGYYTLRGRMSDLIISGGFNIYPREIEEVLAECPGIREAAVVGMPDEKRGEVPVAYLVSDTPLDDQVLERHCRGQLASFKVPRGFVRVDALPRTALGKIQKHLLPPWTPPR
ncbi:MAG: class I adenylate-forming enzyme family protein [Gemmatimonadaceae bacterium]